MTISQQPNSATFYNTIESAIVRFMLDSAGRSSMSLNKITNGERRLLVPPRKTAILFSKFNVYYRVLPYPTTDRFKLSAWTYFVHVVPHMVGPRSMTCAHWPTGVAVRRTQRR